MEAVKQVSPASAGQSIKANQVLVKGRIVDVREWDGQDSSGYVTRCKLPALDEYSSASTVEISSRRKLGRDGDDISQLCNLGGWVKNGKGANGPYSICNMRLIAVE